MAFNTPEISNQDGMPSCLYRFRWGDTYWRYTNADQDIVITEPVAGVDTEVTYTAIAIADSGMTQGGSSENDMTVTVQSDIPLVALFRATPPSFPIQLIIRRKHEGDAEAPIDWVGRVGNVRPKQGETSADIICRSNLFSLKRGGLRLCWTLTCPHFLYDSSCQAQKEDFAVAGEITALTGNTITATLAGVFPVGYFDGGFFSWEVNGPGTIDQRGIESSVTDTEFVVYGLTDRLEIGMDITLYPGCDLSPETCNNKFSNLENHGGYQFMARKSPFNGDATPF